jgi:hypothetical protein
MLVSGAFGLLAVFVVGVALARRRRAARTPALSLGTRTGPAGVNHLAASVSELSDLGFHLRASAAAPRRRLGALRGLR